MNYDFPVGRVFDKGIFMGWGQAPAHAHVDKLLAHIEKGEFKADDVITHRMKLDDAPHGYDIFAKKKDNCVKVVLTPGAAPTFCCLGAPVPPDGRTTL